jgi:hypothetical protein
LDPEELLACFDVKDADGGGGSVNRLSAALPVPVTLTLAAVDS